MTIRPSEHVNEYVVLTQVRPDATQAPTGYTVSEQGKSFVDEFGATKLPPTAFDMLPAATDQPDTRTNIVSSVTVGSKVYTTTITSSNRSLMPVAWRTQITDGGSPTLDKSWLLIGGEAGSGAAMQIAPRFFERWGEDDEAHHNPTQGGAGQTGEDPGFDAYSELRHYGPQVLYYSTTGKHESGWRFLDFGGDPNNLPDSDHGQDETHPILWYASRGHQRVTPNYGGRPLVHRVDYWDFWPTAWDSRGASGRLLSYRTLAMACVANYFDHAFLIDPVGGGSSEVADFAPTAPDIDWRKSWDLNNPLSPYFAVALYSAADDFAVAVVAKLVLPTDDPTARIAATIGAPSYMNLAYSRGPNQGGSLTENANVAINLLSKSWGGRRSGWIGSTHYVVTGKSLEVFAAIQELYSSGALDAEPPTDLPSAITTGTIFPPLSANPTPLDTAQIVYFDGNSQGVTSSSSFLTLDANPEIAKVRAENTLMPGNSRGTLDSRAMIWNDALGVWEMLEHGRNAGGWGDSVKTVFGLESTLVRGLIDRGMVPHIIKCCYTGSPLSGDRGIAGVWATPSPAPITVTASMVVASITGGGTLTAAPGTFTGFTSGMAVLISGSATGHLPQTGNQFFGPEPKVGNNTYPIRPVFVAGVNGDGSVLTLGSSGSSGTSFAFVPETATLTVTGGRINLKAERDATVARATAALTRHRLDWELALHVVQTGEADKGVPKEDYKFLLAAHIAALRSLFSVTGSEADAPPVAIVGLSPHGPGNTDEEIAEIRQAQIETAAEIGNAFFVEINDLPLRFELNNVWPPADRSEVGTHLTPSSTCVIGWRVNAGLDAFDFFPATLVAESEQLNPPGGASGGSSASSASGASVSMIVEDGTGLEDANSYSSIADATAYFAGFGGNATWTAAADEDREAALRYATQWIDGNYGPRMAGARATGTQALEVPRLGAYTTSGYQVAGVPAGLARATAEIAVRWLADPAQLFPDTATASNVASQTSSLGPLSISKSFRGASTTAKAFPVVESLLVGCGLVAGGGWARR